MTRRCVVAALAVGVGCHSDPIHVHVDLTALAPDVVVDIRAGASEPEFPHVSGRDAFDVPADTPKDGWVIKRYTPCGADELPYWWESPVALHVEPTTNQERDHRVDVVIDNRGGAATTVELGSLAVQVEANQVARRAIDGWTCRNTRVRAAGRDLGTVDAPSRGPSGVLVDVAGTHCYDVTPHAYGGGPDDGYHPSSQRIDHVAVSKTEAIDFVFVPVPTSVEGLGSPGLVTTVKYALADCAP